MTDNHNVTNAWKMFDRKRERMGTYDSDLNRIKEVIYVWHIPREYPNNYE
jgi:hypothetical protein